MVARCGLFPSTTVVTVWNCFGNLSISSLLQIRPTLSLQLLVARSVIDREWRPFWQRRRKKHLLLRYSRELMWLWQRKVLQLPPTRMPSWQRRKQEYLLLCHSRQLVRLWKRKFLLLSPTQMLSTGIGVSASRSDKIIQCPSNTSGSQPFPQSSVSAQIYDLRDVSDAVPTRQLSPVASRTRSKLSKELRNEFKPTDSLHQGVEKSTSPATLTTCDVSVIDKNPRLVLELPATLTSITKHHEDFIRCDDLEVANSVKDAMQHQWASLVYPGQKVKVRMKDQLVSAVMEKCYYISMQTILWLLILLRHCKGRC